jgi:hypothetical protein
MCVLGQVVIFRCSSNLQGPQSVVGKRWKSLCRSLRGAESPFRYLKGDSGEWRCGLQGLADPSIRTHGGPALSHVILKIAKSSGCQSTADAFKF